MKKYNHLTQEERYQIQSMRKVNSSITVIAESLGRERSTIYRELKRNTGQKGYHPKQANELAQSRHKNKPKAIKLTVAMQEHITEKLEAKWSPEQIKGRALKEGIEMVSHERIYHYVYRDQKEGGRLYKHLRWSRKKRRKRLGRKDRRGTIPNRIDIEKRPAIVDEKARFGDIEADLIIGKDHKGALLTLVDRKEKYTEIRLLQSKGAGCVTSAIIDSLIAYKGDLHTITFDNGKEFSGHEKVSKELGVCCYFARPYHSWERGLNENTNGLIRQYFPKETNFLEVQEEEVARVQESLNSRPRKALDYASPQERMSKLNLTQGAAPRPLKPPLGSKSNNLENRLLKSAVALMT